MFVLLFDARHRVLLARFSGSLDATDLALHRTLRRQFSEHEGIVPAIVELTAVERVLISSSRINAAGRNASSLFGSSRVVVARPGSETFGLARMFMAVRDDSGHASPTLVGTIEDAFRVLELADPDFRPWPAA